MRLLLLVAIASVAFAEEAKDELTPEGSAHSHSKHSFSDGLELMRHREQMSEQDHLHMKGGEHHSYDDRHHPAQGMEGDGPVILRTPHPLPHDGHPDIHAQNKIIADVFSPDFYQPTWVLDYRYLKTGGRDYTRGPGGQILILPKGVRSKEPKEYPDYDAYLEHLRLSRLSERQHHGHHDHDHGYGHGHHGQSHGQYGQSHGHHGQVHGHHEREHHDHGHGHDQGHGHGQTMWHKYG